VELNYYTAVVNQLQTHAIIHLTNEPFYLEIDATLEYQVKNVMPVLSIAQPIAV
jgi:hypothetical protein